MIDIDDISGGNSFLCEPESCKRILTSTSNAHSFKIMTQNIRSISCNFNNFNALLARININCEVYVLTESWNSVTSTFPYFPGYDIHYTKNNRNQNDGLVIFTKNGLICTVEEPIMNDASCLIVKVKPDTLVIALYRSPSNRNIAPFIDSLDKLLLLYKTYKNIVITGDINIDIKSNNEDPNSNDYLNLLVSHGILAGHTYPTREANCLDHAMIKSKNPVSVLVLNAPLTDHAAVITCIELVVEKYPHRDFYKTKVNYEGILEDLKSFNFEGILKSSEANWAADKLVNLLSHFLSKHSLRVLVPRRLRCLKPWITPGLIRCMRNRDRMYLKCKTEPNNVILEVTYKRYKNFCNDLLKRLKRIYERSELKKHAKNPKKTWETITSIVHTRKQKSIPKELLRIADSPQKSIDDINVFFSNVGRSLANKILNDNDTNNQYQNSTTTIPSLVNSMVMLEADDQEIESIILSLKNDSATGWDGISNRFLKICKNHIVPVLTHVVNLCINTGVFPQVFKTAIIHPIHKAGARDCVNNYRPISVLSALSKVCEKVINKRLISFLEKEHVLSSNQYGFRSGSSTTQAVSNITNLIAKHLDKKEKCVGIFLDLAKAFDTVSAPLLINKMENIGIRGVALSLFKSYMSQRSQRVKIGETTSSDLPVTFGVPQGSVLGPSLFLIYINDLCRLHLTNCQIFSFADDTALVFHGTSWEEARLKAEKGLQTTMIWLRKNVLTLNTDKTKYLTFGISSALLPDTSFSIQAHTCSNSIETQPSCQCAILTRSTTVKYLGVLLDHCLSWKSHLKMIAARTRKLIYVFKTLRHVADTQLLKVVYYSLAQSILSYCIGVWGGAKKSHLILLERAQRALLKVMTFKSFRYPTTKLYTLCDVLTIRQLFILDTILNQHSNMIYDPSLNTTRRMDRVCKTPTYRTSFIKKYNCFLGPFLYNKINKTLGIYLLSKHDCKMKLTVWLKTQNYEDTEKLFTILK